MLGNAIGSPRSGQRTRGSGGLRLSTYSKLCLLRYLDNGVPTLGDVSELDQHIGWNSTKLVQARTLDNPFKRGSVIWDD